MMELYSILFLKLLYSRETYFCIEIEPFIFRRWVHTSLAKPVEMRYNPYTQTIEVIDSVQGMESLVTQMRNELNHLNSAIKNINLSTC